MNEGPMEASTTMAHDATIGPFAKIEFSVPTMVCDCCAEKMRRTLTAISDVQTVKPKLWQKRVHVRYEPSTVQEHCLRETLEKAGFTTIEA